MSIRTVIVDDEPVIVDGLKKMLDQFCPQVDVIATAGNVADAKQILISKAVDLVFLDIKLGADNSFDLLKQLGPVEFQIIFITAHNQFAVDAFRISAIDFLLKPIDPEELINSVEKADKTFYLESLQLKLKSLMYNQQNPGIDQTIVLKTLESYHVVRVKDIIQCEAKGNYTMFHLRNKPNILVSKTLKKYDLILSRFDFFRCHQSHLVNIGAITRFDKKDGGALILENNSQVPVSTRRKEQLFRILSS